MKVSLGILSMSASAGINPAEMEISENGVKDLIASRKLSSERMSLASSPRRISRLRCC